MVKHMQNKTERLEKIKNYLIKLTAQKTKLEKIEFSGELEVGTEVTFLTEEPLEKLELEDKIITFADNKVSAIEVIEGEVEAIEEDVVETEVAGSVQLEEEEKVEFNYEEKMLEQDKRIQLMDEEIMKLLSIIEEMAAKQVDMFSKIETLSKAPAVPSEKKTVENFNRTEIKSRAQRVLAS